jgi:two-component system C4-dicarboxylate transport response regulator DctD
MQSAEGTSSGANWVLIVDDEIDIVSVFKQGLENEGFRVFGFTNPASALEHFRINSREYGAVISDCRMPGINGYEFIKKVKEIKSEAKVFLMTAFEINDAEFRAVLPDVMIDGFIQKPISVKALTQMITEHIRLRGI